jgi:CTP synthase
MTKFIFVTGGVCSSLGKGIASASIGNILKNSDFEVFMQKLDPYLNVDPGTMSPFQHGEVFVTDDGAETDLDLGHYERFIDVPLNKHSTVTTGQVYTEVLSKERKGAYLGGTIQIVPHITDEIIRRIKAAAESKKTDIMIIEIGGTVGDIEGQPYLEAIRQLRHQLGPDNTLFVHLTLLPWLEAARELKTKPTQQSVRELRSMGIQPDVILARADKHIPKKLLEKISSFCDVVPEAVIPVITAETIYEVPINMAKAGLADILKKKLKIKVKSTIPKEWKSLVTKIKRSGKTIKIGIAGKYNDLDDAYLSVIEALKSAGYYNSIGTEIVWIDTEKIEERDKDEINKLEQVDGIVVPGGFGKRGVEGKIAVATYCRKKLKPYLGLCLGAQILTIEYARNMCKIPNATSQEFDPKAEHQMVHYLPGQHDDKEKGGTLRLGAWPCKLIEGTKAHKIYKKDKIMERHRHRYEFNNQYKPLLEQCGLVFSGVSPTTGLMEIVEVPRHPFMIGTQFHPEFLSRPQRPHPLFREFIRVCKNR